SASMKNGQRAREAWGLLPLPSARRRSTDARRLENQRDAGVKSLEPAEDVIVSRVNRAPVEIDGNARGLRIKEAHELIAQSQLDGLMRVPPQVRSCLNFRHSFVLGDRPFADRRQIFFTQSVFGTLLDNVKKDGAFEIQAESETVAEVPILAEAH